MLDLVDEVSEGLGLRLDGATADVGRDGQIMVLGGVLEERAIGPIRIALAFDDVEPGGGESAAVKCIDERGFVDEPAARRVDQHSARFDPVELPASEHAARLVVEVHVQRDDIRLGQQVVEGHLTDPIIADRQRVGRDHIHAEPACDAAHHGPKSAVADDADGAADQLVSLDGLTVPAAVADLLHRRSHVPAAGQNQQPRQLRSGLDRAQELGVLLDGDQLDASPGQMGYVDVIGAGGGRGNDAKALAGVDHLCVHLVIQLRRDDVELTDQVDHLLTSRLADVRIGEGFEHPLQLGDLVGDVLPGPEQTRSIHGTTPYGGPRRLSICGPIVWGRSVRVMRRLLAFECGRVGFGFHVRGLGGWFGNGRTLEDHVFGGADRFGFRLSRLGHGRKSAGGDQEDLDAPIGLGALRSAGDRLIGHDRPVLAVTSYRRALGRDARTLQSVAHRDGAMHGQMPVARVALARRGPFDGYVVGVADDADFVLLGFGGGQNPGQALDRFPRGRVQLRTAQGEGQIAAELDHAQRRVVLDQLGIGAGVLLERRIQLGGDDDAALTADQGGVVVLQTGVVAGQLVTLGLQRLTLLLQRIDLGGPVLDLTLHHRDPLIELLELGLEVDFLFELLAVGLFEVVVLALGDAADGQTEHRDEQADGKILHRTTLSEHRGGGSGVTAPLIYRPESQNQSNEGSKWVGGRLADGKKRKNGGIWASIR